VRTQIESQIISAASFIRTSRYLTAFTGAGISVESGIPPFRGEGGLWNTYDPNTLGLEYFQANPERAWPILKEIFYEHFEKAKPNRAHEVLAAWETRGWLRARGASDSAPGAPDRRGAARADSTDRGYLQVIITQNVDSVQRN
jgi:NAD-dependent SIR2 family protein deacetylase